MGSLALAPEMQLAESFADYTTEAFAVIASDLQEDEFIRARAERLIRRAGELSITHTFTEEQSGENLPRYGSLMEAVHAAADGDMQARKVVETNVRTDVVERTIKAGHITEVEMSVDENGRIWQHGQAMDDVYVNSLRYASAGWQMRERAEAETRNGSRIEHHHRAGRLDDHYFVVISPAADNMSKAEMTEAGFFTDTMTCVVQVTGTRNGRLVTQSAFIAGAAGPESVRYDKAAISHLGSRLQVDLEGLTAAQTIDTPLLIPKELMPNGVIDLVRLYDEYKGTFFGQTKPAEDYRAYMDFCRQRESDLAPTVGKIVNEILANAHAISTPGQATDTLHTLSQKHMVDRAIIDHSIDPRVFGASAAGHIEEARFWYERGQTDRLIESRNQAQKKAVSSSCPTGRGGNGGISGNEEGGESSGGGSSVGEDKDCDFISKECPLCKAKNVRTKVKKIGNKRHISGSCGCTKTVRTEA